jgi:hypothetical protein
MHILGEVPGNLEVEDHVDTADIQTTPSQVGGDQEVHLAVAKRFE